MQTKKDSGPDTRIIVGPYRIPLSRERIHAEILRRLGVCAE